jgi:hypothetical protein
MVRIIKTSLGKKKKGPGANFWTVAAETELDVYQALAKRSLASNQRRLERAFERLRQRAKPRRLWASVYDNACLVLGQYGDVYKRGPARRRGKQKNKKALEQDAARELLNLLRGYAHPDQSS